VNRGKLYRERYSLPLFPHSNGDFPNEQRQAQRKWYNPSAPQSKQEDVL
jgi:hypothetical protein